MFNTIQNALLGSVQSNHLLRGLFEFHRPRHGDHICYISNLNKLRDHYPGWDVTKTLDDIFMELVSTWKAREDCCRVDRELAV